MLSGENVVCIYQDGNMDSFIGAWALWKVYPNAVFINQIERTLPSHLEGRDVYIIGSTIPLVSILEMSNFCSTLNILGFEDSFAKEVNEVSYSLPTNVHIVYDGTKSLAGLAWDYFSVGQMRSPIVNYVEDRVLWRYQYPETRAVTTALMRHPQNFELWDSLILEGDIQQLQNEGRILLQHLTQDVEFTIRTSQRRITIGGYDIPVANVSPTLASDAGLQLAKGEAFAACYWDTPAGREYDLISAGEGIDVSELVRAFGGHGNRHEAKFRVPRNHPLATV